MGIFTLLLWLAEHWWIIAILFVLTAGGAILSGLVSIATIIARFFVLLAAIVSFFTAPKEQTAGKFIYGLVILVLGIWIGHMAGVHERRVAERADDKARVERTEHADTTINTNADAFAKKQTVAVESADQKNDTGRDEYVKSLESKVASCNAVADPSILRALRRIK